MFTLDSVGFTDVLALVAYFFIAGRFIFSISKHGNFYGKLFFFISLIHLIIAVYTMPFGMDAKVYYKVAYSMLDDEWMKSFGQSSTFIYFFTFPLIHFFSLSYLGCFFIYSILGLSGYYLLLTTLIFFINKYDLQYKKHYFYILLLPGVHWWNVNIGKDALMFFGIAAFFTGIIRKNFFLIIVGGLLALIIRSPVMVLFIVGLTIGNVMLNKRVKTAQKMLLVFVSGILFIAFLPLVQERLKLESIELDSVTEVIDQRLGHNQKSGSSVDMTNAIYPVKLFGFLFRPLFYDARDARTFYASLENLVWILMFFYTMKDLRNKLFRVSYSGIFAMLFFAFLLPVLANATTLTNLGIAVRMKTMYFFPLVILFFFSRDYTLRQENTAKANKVRFRSPLLKPRKMVPAR